MLDPTSGQLAVCFGRGRLQNAVLQTYPAVTQFWKYDPKAFLAQPVYSRDYPKASNLEP